MTKKLLIYLFLIFWIPVFAQSPRQHINFNREWKFKLGDHQGADAVRYDDSSWEAVGLPHSFSMPYFLSSEFYVGFGWYRKQFSMPFSKTGKRISLDFEGAFQYTEVFVNGHRAGEHQGGYTGFSIDITRFVRAGNNTFAVRVNNHWNARLAPRAGEHVFSGGIYRDVNLVITDEVHMGWYGTHITTPEVSETSAIVQIKSELHNDGSRAVKSLLTTRIFDPAGKLVARLSSTQIMPAKSALIISQKSGHLVDPRLWGPGHPDMYRAVSTISTGGKIKDIYTTNFGIRSIRWTADQGFFLNGKHIYLRGANVHQDHAGWGDAVTNAGFYRDIRMISDAGFNFIRGSHYPHDPSFAESCDQQGMLFWSENAFWGIGGSENNPEGNWNTNAYPVLEADRKAFDASVLQQLKDMIRINRNHPSIIAWSMSNEPFFTKPATIAPMRKLLEKEVALSRLLDPGRPAAIGGAQRPLDESRIDQLGDVAGYNGDGSTIPEFQHPGFPTIVSEYGSTTADRPGNYEPGWGDLTGDKGLETYAWRSGQAIWCGFDHGSIAGSRLGKMGIVDYFRIPKRAWYWYRNEYVHIAPPVWPMQGKPAKLVLQASQTSGIKTDGTDDVYLLIKVTDETGRAISNSPPVTFTVISGPGEFPTGRSINFEEASDIRIMDGQAAIEFRSYYSGKTLIRATSPGLQPSEVLLDFTGPVSYVNGKSPQVTSRPYVRFRSVSHKNTPQQFGRNNPTFASTSGQNHSAGLAADGDLSTFWQALSSDRDPSWVLDMERGVTVSDVKIIFPYAGLYHYRIELSDDRVNWKTIADLLHNTLNEQSRHLVIEKKMAGRYLRIRFEDQKDARLSEVVVTGIQDAR
ncbi:discoidin domain-containing protein [Mucilaginibacter sp. UR6-1]|uniref:glycoside hydrolase family 2 protein n=1 Tax=Mucilaginibacter sp. UR6-1 TaxID=1435643 RepID=UPI001E5239B9|nr:glycoside hydrolase family 2 TIM barrel-domain containing protein [Mucilaginibacter sp. UR6-1]MCC8407788.1 discoidin domain-containing protein [Mucilaginibacter sp. UR6-1]